MSFLFSVMASLASVSSHAAEEVILLALAGDSTVTDPRSDRDEAGWGWGLRHYARANVKIQNEARGGRSSRSFRNEGHWESVLANDPAWVLIQFGHNDQKGKGPERESDPETDYREHLRQYIREASERGASPVLVTPVVRRTFREDGTLADTLEPYARTVRLVALEMDVPCLDLHALSLQKFSEMGPAVAAAFSPGDKPTLDRTHFSREGSIVLAGWLVGLMHEHAPELGELFYDQPVRDAGSQL